MQNYFVNELVSIMRILGADSDPETASDFIAKYMKNPGAYRRHAAAIQQMRVAPGVKRPSYTDDEYETADADTTEVRDAATAARLAALDGYGRNHRIFDPDMKKANENTGAAASADKQRWLAANEDRENSMMSTVAMPPSYSMQSGLPVYDQREQAIAAKLAALEGNGGGGTVPLVYKQAKKAEKPSYRDMLEANKNLNSHDRFKKYQSIIPNATKADQERNAAKKKAASPVELLDFLRQGQAPAKPGMTLAEQMALIERQMDADKLRAKEQETIDNLNTGKFTYQPVPTTEEYVTAVENGDLETAKRYVDAYNGMVNADKEYGFHFRRPGMFEPLTDDQIKRLAMARNEWGDGKGAGQAAFALLGGIPRGMSGGWMEFAVNKDANSGNPAQRMQGLSMQALLEAMDRDQPIASGAGKTIGTIASLWSPGGVVSSPAAAAEGMTAKIMGKLLQNSAGKISGKLLTGAASNSLFYAVQDVLQGKNANEVLTNLFTNAISGSLGNAGLKMVSDILGESIPKFGTRAYQTMLQSGEIIRRLEPSIDDFARGLREIVDESLGESLPKSEVNPKSHPVKAAGNMEVGDEYNLLTPQVEDAGDKVYSPVNPHPALPQDVQNSFSGGTFTEKVLTEDTTFYRVYGGKAVKVGSYMSRTPQNGGMQSQLDLALIPEWGNTTTYVTQVRVPKGTVIYEGTVAPQVVNGGAGMFYGGGNQVYIPKGELNPIWFGD